MPDTPTPAAPRLVADIPSALTAFPQVIARINGRIPALFLDYDGTLADIAPRPELAILPEADKAIVANVASLLPTAIISGRDRPDVEALVGLPGLTYAGSHGFDIAIAGHGAIALPGLHAHAPLLDRTAALLHEGLDAIPGALIERKAFSIAAHYRQVSDRDYPRFRAALDRVLRDVTGIKEKPGKKVFEFQPAVDWDKGACVLHLLDAMGMAGTTHLPLFLGDDVTDEDAFRALKGRGLGIVIANPDHPEPGRVSLADFRLSSPAEALIFLTRLTETSCSS